MRQYAAVRNESGALCPALQCVRAWAARNYGSPFIYGTRRSVERHRVCVSTTSDSNVYSKKREGKKRAHSAHVPPSL